MVSGERARKKLHWGRTAEAVRPSSLIQNRHKPSMTEVTESKQLIEDYLKSFEARDLKACVDICAEDCKIHFAWRTFRGLPAVEQWHKDRFAADLRVVSVEGIAVDGDTAVADVVITSNRLKGFKVPRLPARVTMHFHDGKVREARFAVRKGSSAAAENDASAAPTYRAMVGPPGNYDLSSAMQFNLLTMLGLRENQFLLDIGCGSLRAGRLFIPYLLPGHYFGVDPDEWLIGEGINNEIGPDMVRIKQPTFHIDSDFTLTFFGRKFDFMLAHSIFTHAAQPQIHRCLSEVSRTLEPDGIFAATMVEGDENYSGDGWVYPGVCTYRFDFMARMVAEHGLACNNLGWPHPAGQTWLGITHPGRKVESLRQQTGRFSRFYKWLAG